MPEMKTMAILANSIRKQHRCVAGKELLRVGDRWSAGGWIRLSDPATEEGEVRSDHTRYEGGGFAQVLDIAEVPLAGPATDPDHPEDRLVDPNRLWTKHGRLAFTDLSGMADRPPELWHGTSDPRSVPVGFVREMAQPASLVLLENPSECRVRWWREQVPNANRSGEMLDKTRRRLSLRFGGRYHEFDITDPEFTTRHQLFDTAVQVPQTLELKPPLFLCLSLTKPFQSKHYKIAATIFEPHA